MTDAEVAALSRERDYLKQRNAQLQGDVADLSAEVGRLRSALERASGRRGVVTPNPLSGGQ